MARKTDLINLFFYSLVRSTQMSSATKKVAIIYGAWVLLCVFWAMSGYGDSKAAHLYLALTGLPIALFSLQITPNGAPLATLVAGLIGWVQWCLVTEINSRWNAWRNSKNDKT